MAGLAFVFVFLPCLAIISFTCCAACRAQQHKAFKVLASACLCLGLVSGLVPVGVLIWASTL
ncbi:hypothetical protein SUDANB70_03636 [Streptomyces sp. enrichment culture]